MVLNNASAMILEREDVPDEGLEIDLSEKPSSFVFENCDFKLNDAVRIKGLLTRTVGSAYFRGDVSASGTLPCSRCLEDFKLEIQSAVRVDFLPEKTNPEEEIELEASDLDVYFYNNETISLLEPVRDQLLISIPIKPLCDDNCTGLCAGCGQNLNVKKCNCLGLHEVDPRLAPLEKLKNLKERL